MIQPPVGILAGTGKLPVMVAEKLKQQEREVYLYRLSQTSGEEFGRLVDRVATVDPTRFSFVPDRLKEDGVKEVILVGDVDKKQIFDSSAYKKADTGVVRKLANLEAKGDNEIVQLACRMLEKKNLRVIGVDEVLAENLTPPGLIAGPKPGPEALATLDVLSSLAIKLADEEVGQAVTGKEQAVIAVEGVEGTSELVARSGELAGSGFVMLKLARSNQDYRYDVPVVGVETVKRLTELGASLLAVEARVTLFLQQNKCCELAEKNGLSMLGWERPVKFNWRQLKRWFLR